MHLTNYPKGSIRELLTIAYPLIITAFSSFAMLFCDRLVLARYDLHAMSAAVAIGSTCFLFHSFGFGITAIAEVFVGQHNGAERFDKIGEPVWQMIWFSILLNVIYWPVALWGDRFLLSNFLAQHGRPYFKILMAFSFTVPLIHAISSFFIGRGKIATVTICALIANAINLTLDVILIFGIKDVIPAMGIEGAAWGTVTGLTIQSILLFILFLRPTHRKKYKTNAFRFNYCVFKDCLHIGFPVSISYIVEAGGWSFILYFLSSFDSNYLAIQAFGSTAWFIFGFIGQGLNKAVVAISSNFMGSHEYKFAVKTLRSAWLVHIISTVVIGLVCLLNLDFIIDQMIADPNLKNFGRLAFYGVLLFYFFDGMSWIVGGTLTAGGDTNFIMIVSTIATWGSVSASLIWLSYFPSQPYSLTLFVSPLLGISCFTILYWRYKKGAWKRFDINQIS